MYRPMRYEEEGSETQMDTHPYSPEYDVAPDFGRLEPACGQYGYGIYYDDSPFIQQRDTKKKHRKRKKNSDKNRNKAQNQPYLYGGHMPPLCVCQVNIFVFDPAEMPRVTEWDVIPTGKIEITGDSGHGS